MLDLMNPWSVKSRYIKSQHPLYTHKKHFIFLAFHFSKSEKIHNWWYSGFKTEIWNNFLLPYLYQLHQFPALADRARWPCKYQSEIFLSHFLVSIIIRPFYSQKYRSCFRSNKVKDGMSSLALQKSLPTWWCPPALSLRQPRSSLERKRWGFSERSSSAWTTIIRGEFNHSVFSWKYQL